MSQENVELVRRLYDAVDRGDSTAVLEFYDPDVEWDISRISAAQLFSGNYRGHEALRRYFREWDDAWERVDYDLEELIDAGDQVIAVVTFRGRGRTSRAKMVETRALVWTIRNGKIVRVVWHPTRAEALEGVGRSE